MMKSVNFMIGRDEFKVWIGSIANAREEVGAVELLQRTGLDWEGSKRLSAQLRSVRDQTTEWPLRTPLAPETIRTVSRCLTETLAGMDDDVELEARMGHRRDYAQRVLARLELLAKPSVPDELRLTPLADQVGGLGEPPQ